MKLFCDGKKTFTERNNSNLLKAQDIVKPHFKPANFVLE